MRLRFTVLLAAVVEFAATSKNSYLHAEELYDWRHEGQNCQELGKPNYFGWCPSILRKDGWELRYVVKSPDELADAFWHLEVWVRNQSALICQDRGGRCRIRMQGCLETHAVAPRRRAVIPARCRDDGNDWGKWPATNSSVTPTQVGADAGFGNRDINFSRVLCSRPCRRTGDPSRSRQAFANGMRPLL